MEPHPGRDQPREVRALRQWREISRIRPRQRRLQAAGRPEQILEDAAVRQVRQRCDRASGRSRAGLLSQRQDSINRDEKVVVLPRWRDSFITTGRFLESLLSLWRMHWDHELWKAPASRTHSKRFAKSRTLGQRVAAFGVRGACSCFCTRIMEILHGLMTAHWDHEPTPIPSQEGNFRGVDDCLLPSREGSGVGRFMESGNPKYFASATSTTCV